MGAASWAPHGVGRSTAIRSITVLVLSLLVAAGLAAVKGRWLDAAYVIGDSSAAYLLLPFLAGRLMPGRAAAVVLGIASTFAALVAFSFTASTLCLGRLSLDFSLGRWFLAGVVSGAVFGLLGHAARRHSLLLYAIPAVLMLEPLAVVAAAAAEMGSGAPPEAGRRRHRRSRARPPDAAARAPASTSGHAPLTSAAASGRRRRRRARLVREGDERGTEPATEFALGGVCEGPSTDSPLGPRQAPLTRAATPGHTRGMTNKLDTRATGDQRRTRAYLTEFAIGMVAYFALLAVAIPLASAVPAGPARWLPALLPLIAVAWVAVAIVRHLQRIDERQRLQALEGLGVGFVVAMLTAVALGLLEPFGLPVPGSPWWIYGTGMLAWLVSSMIQRAR